MKGVFYNNDNQMKEIIRKYQTGEEKLLTIALELAEVIYSFPKMVDNYEEEYCNEFFEYFLSNHLKTVVDNFNDYRVTFKTHFIFYLRKYYNKWKNNSSR